MVQTAQKYLRANTQDTFTNPLTYGGFRRHHRPGDPASRLWVEAALANTLSELRNTCCLPQTRL